MALHKPPLEVPFVDLETGFVTEPWAKWLIIAQTDKANKVEDGTAGNITTLTSDGDIQDGSAALIDVTNIVDNFAELSSTRLLASDGSGNLQEVDLDDWVTAGSRITITDDGDGTITIEASDQVASIDINDYITGTANEITVTDGGDSTCTLSGAGDDTDFTVITEIQAGGAGGVGFQYKTRTLTLNGGIITTVGAESGWNDV